MLTADELSVINHLQLFSHKSLETHFSKTCYQPLFIQGGSVKLSYNDAPKPHNVMIMS